MHQWRHRVVEISALHCTAAIVWRVAPMQSPASVTASLLFVQIGRAHLRRHLQLGRPHRLLSTGAGARSPAEGQAALLRAVLPDRRDRYDVLWDPATTSGEIGRAHV